MNNNIPVAADYIKNFEQLGFGMFVHFGLYSQLNKGEWAYHILKLEKEIDVKVFILFLGVGTKHFVIDFPERA